MGSFAIANGAVAPPSAVVYVVAVCVVVICCCCCCCCLWLLFMLHHIDLHIHPVCSNSKRRVVVLSSVPTSSSVVTTTTAGSKIMTVDNVTKGECGLLHLECRLAGHLYEVIYDRLDDSSNFT